jgi:hypothetical protein
MNKSNVTNTRDNKAPTSPGRVGFVIASEYQDYLGVYIETRSMTHKYWVQTPNDAKVIPTKFQATELLRKLKLHYSAWVLELWENDKHLVVSCESEIDRPAWLS